MAADAVMRLAFVGKGGAGKSSIAGTFARLLARTGVPVVAIDSDPMPGLAYAVGVDAVDAGIPDEAVEECGGNEQRRFRLRSGLGAADVIDRYAVAAADDLRFLQLGKARGPRWNNSRQHAAFQQVLDELPTSGWNVVGDLPAGTRQAFFGWARYAETLLVVVEPTAASVLTARRLARLASAAGAPPLSLVANKVSESTEAHRIAARVGLPLVASVPADDAMRRAVQEGVAPLDHAPTGAAVRAIETLVWTMAEERRSA